MAGKEHGTLLKRKRKAEKEALLALMDSHIPYFAFTGEITLTVSHARHTANFWTDSLELRWPVAGKAAPWHRGSGVESLSWSE